LGQNSLKYWTKVLSPCPWTLIPINVIGNYPSLDTILFFTWSQGKVVLKWSILSWITHKKSSFDCTDLTLQVWYRRQQDSWWILCFFNLISCSSHKGCFFLIWISNPSRIHKQYT
jgi:hypothetical protein